MFRTRTMDFGFDSKSAASATTTAQWEWDNAVGDPPDLSEGIAESISDISPVSVVEMPLELSIATERTVESFSENEVISAPLSPLTPPARSERFWFEDGTVVIQVERTLYKLYKGVLTRQSEYFKSNITAIQPSFTFGKGKKSRYIATNVKLHLVGIGSEGQPLVLQVKEYDFELLLSYMFPEDYNSQNNFTASEWAAIAGVSKKLEIRSVQTSAITNLLKSADGPNLIYFGSKHNLPECYTEGFRRLTIREDSMSLEEGQRLGLPTVIAIAHARDMLSKGSKWSEIEFSVKFETETGGM